jgi:hypothetical protein
MGIKLKKANTVITVSDCEAIFDALTTYEDILYSLPKQDQKYLDKLDKLKFKIDKIQAFIELDGLFVKDFK